MPTEEGYGRTDALARIAEHRLRRSHRGVELRRRQRAGELSRRSGTSGSSTGSSTTPRSASRWRATSASRWARARSTRSSIAYGQPLPPDQRYRSTALLENLHTIELTLRKLQPPAWNAERARARSIRRRPRAARRSSTSTASRCHGPHIAPPALKALNAPLKGPDRSRVDRQDALHRRHRHRPEHGAELLRREGRPDEDRPDRRRSEEASPQGARSPAHSGRPRRSRRRSPASAPSRGSDGGDRRAAEAAAGPRRLTWRTQLSKIDPTSLSVGAGAELSRHDDPREGLRRRAATPRSSRPSSTGSASSICRRSSRPTSRGRSPASGRRAPFLHNGSVPTVYDLLSPVASVRRPSASAAVSTTR